MWGKKKSKRAAKEERFGPLYSRAYSLGPDRIYVAGGRENRGRIIGTELYAVLQHLRGFKTADEHLDQAGSRMRGRGGLSLSTAHIEGAIRSLIYEGLIVSQEDFLSYLRSRHGDATAHHPGHSISAIAWPTKNRHTTLLRSIAGAVRNVRMYRRDPELHVYDDERPSNPVLLRKLLHFTRRHHTALRYCGIEEKRTYIDELSGYAGLGSEERDLLEFALYGDSDIPNTNGANRNALLLGTAGRKVYSADDDTLFRFADTGTYGDEGRIVLQHREQLDSARHFPDLAMALSSLSLREIDVLGRHARFLGRTLTDILAAFPGSDIDLGNMDPSHSIELLKHPEKTVRLSISGLLGDSGRPNNHMLLGERALDMLTGELESDELEGLIESRSILRYTASQVLGVNGHFMSTQFAMDNGEILPPYFPNGTGIDGHFGTLLHFISRGALFSYHPFAFVHAPPDRSNTYAEGMTRIHTRVNDFFIRMIDSIYKNVDMIELSEEERMRYLGERFIDIGGMSSSRFLDYLREVNVSYLSRYIEHIEENFSSLKNPAENLVKTYHAHLDAVKNYMLGEEVTRVGNIETDPAGGTDRFRRIIEKYGRLLLCWPGIHKSAAAAREDGIHAGRSIPDR